MAPGRLQGKTAVITGSGRGIGRAIALLMAREGANVVVNDPGVEVEGGGYDEAPARAVVAQIKEEGGNAVANFDSVMTVEGGENIVKAAVDNFGRIDILVNNAGILRERMVFNMSPEEWDDVVYTHLHGQFNTIRPASALMRQQKWGRIINTTSMVGLGGSAGQVNYGSSKVAVAGLTRAVARDLGAYGITCNSIAAGAATRMTDRHRNGTSPAEVVRQNNPDNPEPDITPGIGGPTDVAPMVCFLASDDAWNINGQSFRSIAGTVAILNNPEAYRGTYNSKIWTLDDLDDEIPQLLQGISNPAPPAEDIEVPGRPAPAATTEESKNG